MYNLYTLEEDYGYMFVFSLKTQAKLSTLAIIMFSGKPFLCPMLVPLCLVLVLFSQEKYSLAISGSDLLIQQSEWLRASCWGEYLNLLLPGSRSLYLTFGSLPHFHLLENNIKHRLPTIYINHRNVRIAMLSK